MKVCPSCRKTYADDGLNFCLDDGSILSLVGNEPPETVLINQSRFTDPNPMQGQEIRTTYGDQPGFSMQPKKSSKTWVWVLLILGALVLACGGGFAAFVIYVASLEPGLNTSNSSPTPTPRSSPTATPFPRNNVTAVDLSDWVQEDASFGNTSFSGSEFFMSSKKKGFYYVVAAPAEYKTERASTSVTLRAVDDVRSSLGYGLVFHSNPKPLQKGYAFLIDAKGQRYRVVRHEPGKELNVVSWTNSSAIRGGTVENKLEVRDLADRIEIYANGEMLTTIKNTHGYSGGVVGLYTGDAVNIAFKDLEIAK